MKPLIALSLITTLLLASNGAYASSMIMTDPVSSETNNDKSVPTDNEKQSSDSSKTNDAETTTVADEVKIRALPQTNKIVVQGRTLTGANSLPRQVGYRVLLPITNIARILGDIITLDQSTGIVEVRRQNGVITGFNPQMNQVTENGSVILSTSSAADIIIAPTLDELMLPIEIVSALLDVSIFFDENAHLIRIDRGKNQADRVRTGARHSAIEFYQGSYDYSLNSYSSTLSHNLTMRVDGRIYDGRFDLTTNSGGGTGNPFTALRRGTFTYERPNGQKFIGGDFGTGTDLSFMSSTVRGGLTQLPIKGARFTGFAGRAVSGIVPDRVDPFEFVPPELIQEEKYKEIKYTYDTTVVGGYLTFDSSTKSQSNNTYKQLSIGGLHFNGPNHKGQMVSSSLNYGTRRSSLHADLGIGHFSGFRSSNEQVRGLGIATDLSGSFNVTDNWSVQGRYSYIGRNFMGAQAGLHEPIKLLSGATTWRPKRWMSTTFAVTTNSRPNSSRDGSLSYAINITPTNSLPTLLFSHTQGMGRNSGNGYTLLNLTKTFSRWNLYSNTVRVKSFNNIYFNTQLGSNIRINNGNTLQVNQSIGNRGSLSGSLDWASSSIGWNRISFSIGSSYYKSSTAPININGRLSANVRLPGEHSLQFNYLRGQSGAQFLMSLRGPLLPHKKRVIEASGPISELNSYGTFYGRVYQDVNLNGKFEPGLDLPQAKVKVRIDGNRYAESDQNGLYRIEDVKSGSHSIYLDLLSIRADLTILDGTQSTVSLPSGRDMIVDFRLVRTGRITGTVWFDKNENGEMDKDEQPLGDVRIVVGSGADNLTDPDGIFVIGDLPPGEHTVLIDEKTLPENTRSIAGTLRVKVNAGSETSGIKFPVRTAPAELKRF
jgi:hypothetical protein